LRGIEVTSRSVFAYYHDFWIGSPNPSEEELHGELVFADEPGSEQGDTGSENDVYLEVGIFKTPHVDPPL
jgi:hypothetical protein